MNWKTVLEVCDNGWYKIHGKNNIITSTVKQTWALFSNIFLQNVIGFSCIYFDNVSFSETMPFIAFLYMNDTLL